MKKTVVLLLFIIISISCQTNTGPIVTEANVEETFKSISPALGDTYLWVTITPGDISKIEIKYGDNATAGAGTGETITRDNNNNINEISPTDKNNNTSYGFQTGTVTGSLELLDKNNIKISFTQNVSPYTKVMEAICEKQNQ